MDHVRLLAPLPLSLRSLDGKEIEVLELPEITAPHILSSWAGHIRNHYCLDNRIDSLRGPTGKTRAAYLIDLCFPDNNRGLGPATRSGDVTEILVADYLQYTMDYWVPRLRYRGRYNKNSSTQGSDVIGFKVVNRDTYSDGDILLIYEVKAKLSGIANDNVLQKAVNDSAKDHLRVGITLAALKTQYDMANNDDAVNLISRFQNPVEAPYQQKYGAAGVFTDRAFDSNLVSNTDTSTIPSANGTMAHPQRNDLHLLVIKGMNLMPLVHQLYQIAADEA